MSARWRASDKNPRPPSLSLSLALHRSRLSCGDKNITITVRPRSLIFDDTGMVVHENQPACFCGLRRPNFDIATSQGESRARSFYLQSPLVRIARPLFSCRLSLSLPPTPLLPSRAHSCRVSRLVIHRHFRVRSHMEPGAALTPCTCARMRVLRL